MKHDLPQSLAVRQHLAAAGWHAERACEQLRWSNFEKNYDNLKETYQQMRRHFWMADLLRAHAKRLTREEWLQAHRRQG